MKDIRLIVLGILDTFESEIIKTEEIPRVGDHITTIYFQNKYLELKNNSIFRVKGIVHHYFDDMSGIDYTTIKLERLS